MPLQSTRRWCWVWKEQLTSCLLGFVHWAHTHHHFHAFLCFWHFVLLAGSTHSGYKVMIWLGEGKRLTVKLLILILNSTQRASLVCLITDLDFWATLQPLPLKQYQPALFTPLTIRHRQLCLHRCWHRLPLWLHPKLKSLIWTANMSDPPLAWRRPRSSAQLTLTPLSGYFRSTNAKTCRPLKQFRWNLWIYTLTILRVHFYVRKCSI